MKILIAGCGKVGETLAKQLSSEGHDITLLDSSHKVLESVTERIDVLAIEGNCSSMDALKRAEIESNSLMIACTGSDEVNLLSCLTARRLNPNLHTIARIRDPEYIEQVYEMRDSFGISMIFNPEQQAATEISRILKYPGFFKRDTFASGRVEIVELRVDEESRLKDVPLMQMSGIVKCKVLVCAVIRDGKSIIPAGSFVLRTGDRVFVTASGDELATMLKNLGTVTHKVRRVVIAGGGAVGYYLAEQLAKSQMDIMIIEKDPDRCVEMASLLPHVKVIQDDAGSKSALEREGVDSADALLALTGIDELNILISLYGNNYHIPQIVTKLSRMEPSNMTDNLPLGTVISPRMLCCSTVVRYVRAMQNQSGAAVAIHSIADGQVEAMEFRIDDDTPNCGIPLRRLKLRQNVLLSTISRGTSVLIPNGDSSFHPGDHVVVVAAVGGEVIGQFGDIFA